VVRIMPGVRVRVSSRGIGMSAGPRIARVHVSPRGRVGVSSGLGPLAGYTTLGGHQQQRRRSSSRQPSAATLQRQRATAERQIARARKEDEIGKLAGTLHALIRMHDEEFGTATRPVAETTPGPDETAIRAEQRSAALADAPTFSLKRRREAKAHAEQLAAVEIERQRNAADELRTATQRELDRRWDDLCANEPATVLGVLEAAFEDNEAPAVPINCEGATATVVVLVQPLSFLPDKKPTLTEAGNVTLRNWALGDRNDFYASYVRSATIATAKEAFAVAVGLARVSIITIRREPRAEGPDALEALWCVNVERSANTATDAAPIPDLEVVTKGRTRQVQPLDVSGHSSLHQLLVELAQQVDCVVDPRS
jgi:hypothetical protein